jgi:antitoxin component YwqK of YwqJK toxin-antitoxin module
MVRPAKWISSTALGLALAWQGGAAQAQRFPFEGEPTPAHGEASDDADSRPDDDADDSSRGYSQSDDQAADDASQGDDRTPRSLPATDDVPESDPSATPDQSEAEVIRERFPNGSPKIERDVTQDAQGNYLNHGAWKMWDQRGGLVAQGEYRYGNRTGEWIRWYRSPSEVELLTKPPYQHFVAPFISQATFQHGQLHGTWTIYDGKKHKISQWEFTDGKRNGLSTWYFPNGHKMREVEYRDGEIDGHLTEWGQEGSVLVKDTYQAGHRVAEKISKHPGGGKKSQGMYLFAKDVEQTPDDWWNCKLLVTTKAGKDEKHGESVTWHANGQMQQKGNFEHDMQVGEFTWWHNNGQKALQGHFAQGKQDGTWTWWYPSGQKSIHGQYAHGNPTGRWTWWKEDGKVAQSADLSNSEGVVVETPHTREPAPLPHAARQVPQQPLKR